MELIELDGAQTWPLRKRVLRGDDPAAPGRFPEDDQPGVFHLGVRDSSGMVVAIATFIPGDDGVQLRGMAVDPRRQGEGIGSLLVDGAATRLRDLGIERLWCHARDTAIGFYERMGFRVISESFIHGESGLPHTTMELML
jgi:ribosomal protein S18 acetylase RimI-like enzyme